MLSPTLNKLLEPYLELNKLSKFGIDLSINPDVFYPNIPYPNLKYFNVKGSISPIDIKTNKNYISNTKNDLFLESLKQLIQEYIFIPKQVQSITHNSYGQTTYTHPIYQALIKINDYIEKISSFYILNEKKLISLPSNKLDELSILEDTFLNTLNDLIKEHEIILPDFIQNELDFDRLFIESSIIDVKEINPLLLEDEFQNDEKLPIDKIRFFCNISNPELLYSFSDYLKENFYNSSILDITFKSTIGEDWNGLICKAGGLLECKLISNEFLKNPHIIDFKNATKEYVDYIQKECPTIEIKVNKDLEIN